MSNWKHTHLGVRAVHYKHTVKTRSIYKPSINSELISSQTHTKRIWMKLVT